MYVTLCILPIVGLYALMFYWFPQQLIVLREAGGNTADDQQFLYLQFGYGNFIHLPLLYSIYPVITFISVCILLYAAYSRKAFTFAEKSELEKLNYSLEVATLSSRVFTHAVKNDIIALQILMEKLTGKIQNKDEVKDEVSKINEVCKSNLDRMNELKSRINIGNVKVKRVDAKDVVRQGIEKASVPSNISVSFDPASDPVMVYMDNYYFSEVISALIQNAVDAIKITGREDGKVTIDIKQNKKEIYISVKDNGCGIDREKINLIFDPFYTTKPSTQNWGLGLFFCNMILQIHNGEIHFNINPGEGSEAVLYLPSKQVIGRKKDAG
jgi:Signal transduction histidine kinase